MGLAPRHQKMIIPCTRKLKNGKPVTEQVLALFLGQTRKLLVKLLTWFLLEDPCCILSLTGPLLFIIDLFLDIYSQSIKNLQIICSNSSPVNINMNFPLCRWGFSLPVSASLTVLLVRSLTRVET